MQGLYRPEFERDNCGFGLMAQMDGISSHSLVLTAIGALSNMTHRGAIAADGKSGDGCGLLLKLPDEFFRKIAATSGFRLNKNYAVGCVFLNQHPAQASLAKKVFETEVAAEGLSIASWREVPVYPEVCGDQAKKNLPHIEQVLINAPDQIENKDFNRRLYFIRRRIEKQLKESDDTFYVASLSNQVVSYKGLVMPEHLAEFYLDLLDPNFTTSICLFHQRFSTNTLPQWRLAQPFRYLAHNGEINTLQGNRYWAMARANKFKSDLFPNMEDILPLVSATGSDSMSLDNMLDVLLSGGMDVFMAMRLLIPPAWQKNRQMDENLKAFYEYTGMMMEPWDGPAGIVLTDGRYASCLLDRNGLRPARWVITKDRIITLASETGVHPYQPEDVVRKGRLMPGQMIAVDTETGKLLLPEDIDNELKSRQDYSEWYRTSISRLQVKEHQRENFSTKQLLVFQKQFGVSLETLEQVLKVLGDKAQEAVGSMGDDTPMAVLSEEARSLFDYFRQQFAQVTNPPIDPLRESIIMSLETNLGRNWNLFQSKPEGRRISLTSPLLQKADFEAIKNLADREFVAETIKLNYRIEGEADGSALVNAITAICRKAVDAVLDGTTILILSDRDLAKDHLPIHALMATGAVHHHLTSLGLRGDANIVLETGTALDSHHFAALIGFGATAIYPYLGLALMEQMVTSGDIRQISVEQAQRNYLQGISKGLYKIMSKVGISTVASYRGAQLFEAIGLHDEVIGLCFEGVTCRIQGARFSDLELDQEQLHQAAWNPLQPVHPGGLLKYVHNTEYHAFNPEVVKALQKAVQGGEYQDYQVFADLVNDRPVSALRDMLRPKLSENPLDLDQVEAVEKIFPRFNSAGMSLGALSPEAHEALAIAMNRLGGMSNSGEGGEDPARYNTERSSSIKQVASGRFGVTPAYLVSAKVLQIKIAQGAKPGEGGQLPGHKVNELIARLRYTVPGVTLISPPPHHDIYSIEDLAQLIFDLKQVNPLALISVKLVAKAGVGTIAAGVAKAYADLITISGYDGGTGASPLTSVKYAGIPWEIGLAEAHQVLRANDLRDKVILQTDGGLKTGLDVIKAAMLGAESFGFGTAPMIALGCKYLRICHLNNCATGVATQNEILRKQHFIGLPEMVENYFRFVAEETRQWMAKLGVTSITELIGRTDLLELLPGSTRKQRNLDLRPLLAGDQLAEQSAQFCASPGNIPWDKGTLAEQMVDDCRSAIEGSLGGIFNYPINNTNRSIGARLSGEIARLHGNDGMKAAPLNIKLRGTAGQSLGVWNAGGLNLELEGDANDYVGKGMAGGKIVIYPPKESAFATNATPIMGNTCLYGATGGKLYAAGQAGERFAVRNSGCHALVEGVGDHACEYMTGGVVVSLGPAGQNFGAGMTGGIAFILDEKNQLAELINPELIELRRITPDSLGAYRAFLKTMIEDHVQETGSAWGASILGDFNRKAADFWLVKPKASAIEVALESVIGNT